MVAQPSIFSLGSGPVDGQPDRAADLARAPRERRHRGAAAGLYEGQRKGAQAPPPLPRALRRRLEIKNNIVAFVSEFVGTVLFLFFAFGIATEAANARASTQNNGAVTSLSQNAPPDTSALLFSSLGFGFSLAVNAWTFYRVSGGLFNPAVTLALFLTGTLGWFQLIHLTIAQIAGAIAASALVRASFPAPSTPGPRSPTVPPSRRVLA